MFATTQIARHRCGGWATGGPAEAATGADGPLVAHPRYAIWAVGVLAIQIMLMLSMKLTFTVTLPVEFHALLHVQK